jgi:hypothetical protein
MNTRVQIQEIAILGMITAFIFETLAIAATPSQQTSDPSSTKLTPTVAASADVQKKTASSAPTMSPNHNSMAISGSTVRLTAATSESPTPAPSSSPSIKSDTSTHQTISAVRSSAPTKSQETAAEVPNLKLGPALSTIYKHDDDKKETITRVQFEKASNSSGQTDVISADLDKPFLSEGKKDVKIRAIAEKMDGIYPQFVITYKYDNVPGEKNGYPRATTFYIQSEGFGYVAREVPPKETTPASGPRFEIITPYPRPSSSPSPAQR